MAAASFVVEMVVERVVSFLQGEEDFLLGTRREFNHLNHELEIMKSLLKDADRKDTASMNEGFRIWLEQLRDVAYDVEDSIDEFTYRIDKQRSAIARTSPFMRPLRKLISLPKDIHIRHQIITELKRIETEIIAVSTRGNRYGLAMASSYDDDALGVQRYHVDSSSFVGEDFDLVGIDKNKEKLLEWLMDKEPERTVISVVGMGGMGKTTLVRSAYNSQIVKKHFDCWAWIYVSQTYEIEDLLRSMIQKIFKSKNELVPKDFGNMDYRWLVETLFNHMQQSRYVVVLDDVWNISLWNEIRVVLPNSTHGSRIMLTTRNEDIARSFFEIPQLHVLQIEPLSDEEAWGLFCRRAFPSSAVCPPELEHLARVLIQKCVGLPLAIVAMGGLMVTKGRSELQWRKVYDSLNWGSSKNTVLDRVNSILLLSFNDLPYFLKHCFLYCCVFPEDYSIKSKRLIRLWIGEGLVREMAGMTLKEVAYTYLTELIYRNMLQVVETNNFGRPKACRMHVLMRDLGLSISERENFCALDDDRQETRKVGRTRRLSLHKIDNISQSALQIHWHKLRSLLVFTPFLDTLPLGLRLLRVLDLQSTHIEKVPNELAALFNLRYLNLRGTRIKELPKSMGKLQNLQFLDISRTYVEALPSSTAMLQNLHYLKMYHSERQGVKAPLEVCKFKNLQVLAMVKADGDMVREVGNLTQLRTLAITNVREAAETELCASIQRMYHLERLTVEVANEKELLPMNYLEAPPPLLQNLSLTGILMKVPHWFRRLENLVVLRLYGSRIKEDLLSSIQGLPQLHKLYLNNASDEHELYFRANEFLMLKTLYLVNMQLLNQVIFDKGALSSVHELYIEDCKELKMLPQGIENLVKLQKLYVLDVSNELMEQIQKEDRPEVRQILQIYQPSISTSGDW